MDACSRAQLPGGWEELGYASLQEWGRQVSGSDPPGPSGGSRRALTHWAVRKTLSQAALFYPAPDLPLKGAQAQLGPGPVPSACLAAFHKGSSVPSQFLWGAQCPGAAAPHVGRATAGGVGSGWRGRAAVSSPGLFSSEVQRAPVPAGQLSLPPSTVSHLTQLAVLQEAILSSLCRGGS